MRNNKERAEKSSPKLFFSARFLAMSGLIAALYVALTILSSAFGLSSGLVQIRISESLCLLPAFTPAAVPGLFIGCLLANLISGCAAVDIAAGSLVTLLAALLTYALRKNRWLAALPPIMLNTPVIPLLLKWVYHLEAGIWLMFLSVAIGEVLSVGVLGELLYTALDKRRSDIF